MTIKIALDEQYDPVLKSKLTKLLEEKSCSIIWDSNDYDILLTTRNGSRPKALHAHTQGRVVVATTEHLTKLDVEDIIEGHIGSNDWYAKVFEDPIVIGNPNNMEMRLGATINPRAIILNNGLEGEGGHVFLDRGTHIGADCLLNLGPTNFRTGKFSLISANFSAHAMRHTTSHISNYALKKGPFAFMGDVYESAEDIKIGHDVWIGERVTCLPGVEIATGSVIGAGSIVTKSTQPYGIYAGNPAKFIRPRFKDDVIETLLQSEWWNFSYKRLQKLQDIFRQNIKDISAERIKEILQC